MINTAFINRTLSLLAYLFMSYGSFYKILCFTDKIVRQKISIPILLQPRSLLHFFFFFKYHIGCCLPFQQLLKPKNSICAKMRRKKNETLIIIIIAIPLYITRAESSKKLFCHVNDTYIPMILDYGFNECFIFV